MRALQRRGAVERKRTISRAAPAGLLQGLRCGALNAAASTSVRVPSPPGSSSVNSDWPCVAHQAKAPRARKLGQLTEGLRLIALVALDNAFARSSHRAARRFGISASQQTAPGCNLIAQLAPWPAAGAVPVAARGIEVVQKAQIRRHGPAGAASFMAWRISDARPLPTSPSTNKVVRLLQAQAKARRLEGALLAYRGRARPPARASAKSPDSRGAMQAQLLGASWGRVASAAVPFGGGRCPARQMGLGDAGQRG